MKRTAARSFRDLLVWRKGNEFVSQVRRAAVSAPANIAEGFRRRGKVDKARFMNLATLAITAEEVSRLLGAYAAAILTPES